MTFYDFKSIDKILDNAIIFYLEKIINPPSPMNEVNNPEAGDSL